MSANVNGTSYDIQDILVISSSTDVASIEYGKIKYIVISSKQDEIFFLYCKLNNTGMCNHLNAMEVTETSTLHLVSQNCLVYHATCIMKVMSDDKYYVLYNY